MITITNVSRVIDYSGEAPVETLSNPVQTTVSPGSPPREIPYYYDLSDCCCCCCNHYLPQGNGFVFDGTVCF
ncbi:MAG: hypothetical protein ACLR3U_09315 [Christensenellaceae bacterium]|nr:hypothetical protein [Clostridia bacterium]PWM00193.1 MAG: hypothetical protein DBY05_07820 [Clostridiales bacterium]